MVHYLEKMKVEWRPQSEAEAEFLRVIRQMKTAGKIFTCSHTLQLLVDKFKELNEDNDWLTERVGKLEAEMFSLAKELENRKTVTYYL